MITPPVVLRRRKTVVNRSVLRAILKLLIGDLTGLLHPIRQRAQINVFGSRSIPSASRRRPQQICAGAILPSPLFPASPACRVVIVVPTSQVLYLGRLGCSDAVRPSGVQLIRL